MIKEALEFVLSLSPASVLSKTRDEIHGVQNWAKVGNKLEPLKPECPVPLEFSTLTGLVDYLEQNRDELDLPKVTVHVESHNRVAIIGPAFSEWKLRRRWAKASVEFSDGIEFGDYYDSEFFVTMLMSQFVETPDLKRVQAISGNITGEKVTTASDDGITQTVVTKSGVQLTQRSEIVNPFRLRPFRTFPEILQPESPFVFRVKQDRDGQAPKCALFEADGGKWKVDAVEKIAEWLSVQLKGADVNVPVIR